MSSFIINKYLFNAKTCYEKAIYNHEKTVESTLSYVVCGYYKNKFYGREVLYKKCCENNNIKGYLFLNKKMKYNPYTNYCMKWCCESTSLEILGHLLMFELNSSYLKRAFTFSCKIGNLEVVQFLQERFGIGISKSDYIQGLQECCSNNQLEVAELLYKDDLDFKPYCAWILEQCSKKGYLQIYQWIYHTVYRDEIIPDCMNHFDSSCTNDHFIMAEWMFKTFGLTPFSVNATVHHAYLSKKKNAIKWLIKNYSYAANFL